MPSNSPAVDPAVRWNPRLPAFIEAIRYADLFATIVDDDTYAVASEIHDLLVKTHIADIGKIEEIKKFVELAHVYGAGKNELKQTVAHVGGKPTGAA